MTDCHMRVQFATSYLLKCQLFRIKRKKMFKLVLNHILLQNFRPFAMSYCTNLTPMRQFIAFLWFFEMWMNVFASKKYFVSFIIKIPTISQVLWWKPMLLFDDLLYFYDFSKCKRIYWILSTILFIFYKNVHHLPSLMAQTALRYDNLLHFYTFLKC